MKFSIKKIHIAEIIIGSIFIILGIFHTNIWFDEAYSVAIARHSFSEIWTIGGNDVHPILYYLLLHIIQVITNGSILAYRLFSAIPIIILGILGYTHIRKDFDEKTGIIFSFLVYFLPITVVYANQIRMYSWAILSVTILAIYAYRIYKGKTSNSNLIILGLSSLFSIYTHYYGLMAAGIINVSLLIYLIIKKDKKTAIKIFIMGLIQLIAYIPWILNFMTQLHNVSGGFWIGFSFPKTLIELLSFEYLGNSIIQQFGIFHYIVFGLSIILYIYLGIKLVKLTKKKIDVKAPIIAIIIYIAVIISALIMTIILTTLILYHRYLYVITGIYIFVISYILAKEENKKISIGICAIIMLLGIYSNATLILEDYSKTNKEPMEYIEKQISEGDTVAYEDVQIGAIIAEKFPNNKQFFYNKQLWNIEEAYKAFLPQMEVYRDENFIQKSGDRIWLIGPNDEIYKDLFENNNYNKISEETFQTKYQNNKYVIILVEKVK